MAFAYYGYRRGPGPSGARTAGGGGEGRAATEAFLGGAAAVLDLGTASVGLYRVEGGCGETSCAWRVKVRVAGAAPVQFYQCSRPGGCRVLRRLGPGEGEVLEAEYVRAEAPRRAYLLARAEGGGEAEIMLGEVPAVEPRPLTEVARVEVSASPEHGVLSVDVVPLEEGAVWVRPTVVRACVSGPAGSACRTGAVPGEARAAGPLFVARGGGLFPDLPGELVPGEYRVRVVVNGWLREPSGRLVPVAGEAEAVYRLRGRRQDTTEK